MSEKLKGEAREVYGTFIGEAKKEEGRALRRKTEAQKERDRQRLKGEGVLGGLTGKKEWWAVSPITSPAASGRR